MQRKDRSSAVVSHSSEARGSLATSSLSTCSPPGPHSAPQKKEHQAPRWETGAGSGKGREGDEGQERKVRFQRSVCRPVHFLCSLTDCHQCGSLGAMNWPSAPRARRLGAHSQLLRSGMLINRLESTQSAAMFSVTQEPPPISCWLADPSGYLEAVTFPATWAFPPTKPRESRTCGTLFLPASLTSV